MPAFRVRQALGLMHNPCLKALMVGSRLYSTEGFHRESAIMVREYEASLIPLLQGTQPLKKVA